jgi:hypothetical protein
VDVSVWDRCDAETSPERGYYYHPSKHSAGQPIVAGWAYQFVAQLNYRARELDRSRGRAARSARSRRQRGRRRAGEVFSAAVPVAFRSRDDATPLFVFDAGYDPVSRCSRALREAHARYSSAYGQDAASTVTRVSRTRQKTSDALVASFAGRR